MSILDAADKIKSNLDKEEMLNFLFSLIETETVNPPGNEYLLQCVSQHRSSNVHFTANRKYFTFYKLWWIGFTY